MGVVMARPTNGVSYGINYTVLPADITAGYVQVTFNVDLFRLAYIPCVRDVNGVSKANTGLTITYPTADVGSDSVRTVGTIRMANAALASAIAETTLVTVPTMADYTLLNDTYFYISSTAVDYYVWFNVDSTGTDPTIADHTGIEVTLDATPTKAEILAAMETAIDAVTGVFTSTDATDTITIVNTVAGTVTPAHDSATAEAPTGFTFARTVAGATNVFEAGDVVTVLAQVSSQDIYTI
jgi:hypothetical protein